MKNVFKPYRLLLHFLSLILFFFIGILYAGFIEAGKGQMLAGGAIILGYGVFSAVIGLCLSLFVSYKSQRRLILRLNIVITILILCLWGYFYMKYQQRQKEKIEKQKLEQLQKTTVKNDIKEIHYLTFLG